VIQHPHQLHAQAALWSLRRALRHLDEHRDALLIRRPQLGPPESSPRSLASLARRDELLRAEKAERKAGSLMGLKPSAGSPAPGDAPGLVDLEREANAAFVEAFTAITYALHRTPLAWTHHWHDHLPDADWTWLAMALTVVPAGVAEAAWHALEDADQQVRAYVGLDADLLAPPYAPPCPVCDRRRLRVQTSAPDSARWTIVCAPSCICAGELRCIPCGEECEADCEGHDCSMDVPTRGVRHIWAADSWLATSIRAGIEVMAQRLGNVELAA
jgi:hypothetical protein